MSAEIADGWLPLFYSPRMDGEYRALLAEGFAQRAPERTAIDAFEVVATVPVVIGADVESAADSVRPFIALYAGGMGAKGANFHRAVLDRLGYTEACDEIQAHYLAGDRARATAAVPLELVQDIALVGTVDDIRGQLPAWESTAITTMLVQADPRSLPAIAEALRPTV
jgi:alkanesulfonate monooxygenase SsuD/methylene tetrahydromethanopterin reductase-like flavin-dependent oxidoreductase (luciferase family)